MNAWHHENQSILYWKWADQTLKEDIAELVEDICRRTQIGTLMIGVHSIRRPFSDPVLQQALRIAGAALKARNRRFCVEVCPRNELAAFEQAHQVPKAYLLGMTTMKLDENGCGHTSLKAAPVHHYWRISGQNGCERIAAAYCLTEISPSCYKRGSLQRITKTSLVHQVQCSERVVHLSADAGPDNAGKTAVLFHMTPQPIPDLASPHLESFFAQMICAAADLQADGAFSDEWGYDVILEIKETNPYEDPSLHLSHLSWSEAFENKYRQMHGCSLADHFLKLFYHQQGEKAGQVAAINRYLTTLRTIMAENDAMMYRLTKQTLGHDAFFGVHPTWWGAVTDQFFEVFKNGFYWWEAQRDHAQTDECVILPIRTALAHKWGQPLWYNMWYSMGTLDIASYFKDTWNSVRFGGRTHYHGYQCPGEVVVLELKQPGLLEQIECMDRRVRMLDSLQTSHPDCRVLLLFSMQAATNWLLSGNGKPPFAPQSEVLSGLLHQAQQLFEMMLCDLVPSSEVENGSLSVNEEGQACYGTQVYDAVVLLSPECMPANCYDFLGKLRNDRLIVCGSASMLADGMTISNAQQAVLSGCAQSLPQNATAEQIVAILLDMGVPANRTDAGCRYQDGTYVFTAAGSTAINNPLQVKATLAGHQVEYNGEDFLYLDFRGEAPSALFPSGKLLIDGRAVHCTNQ